jgi:two-component system response regulator FixJ
VDDDAAVRESLGFLMESVGIECETFASGKDFLAAYRPDQPGCLVSDIRMPGLSGLDVQRELRAQNDALPIIFITGHGDIPMAVEAMRHGAIGFLQKPFRDQELLDQVHAALDRDRSEHDRMAVRHRFKQRLATLTAREKDVMALVVQGLPNKSIAADLNVSHRTVEIHRARVMEKMEARSIAELVRMDMSLGSEA